MDLYKIIKWLVIVLSVVGFGFFLFVLIKGDDYIATTGEGIDWFIYIAYITLFLTLLFVAIFVIKGIFAGNIMKTIIPIAAFVVIIAVSFMLADGKETVMSDGGIVSATESRWIGAGLYTFYTVALIAIGAMIFSGFKKVSR